MSKDPNKHDPKSQSPKSKDSSSKKPQSAGNQDDEIFDLSEVEGIPIQPLAEPPAQNEIEGPIAPPSAAIPAPVETVSFDISLPSEDPGSLTSGISLGELPELANFGESTGLTGLIPKADPASGHIPPAFTDPASDVSLLSGPTPGSSVMLAITSDNPDSIAELEPVAPVAPASGWWDGDDLPGKGEEKIDSLEKPLEVHQADLLDAPPVPAIESSDIFSSGPIPSAMGTDHSDVIAATAFGPTFSSHSDKPARPSEIALSFDQPLGGSTIESESAGDLPVADEVPESSENLLDSAKLAATPPLTNPKTTRHDEPDFGSMPIATPDASSILADLSDPGEITFDESSAVRLDSPGVQRTLSNNPEDGTEFDLEITDDPVAPELDEAAADSGSGDVTDWRQHSGSDLFAEGRSAPEFDLESERVNPFNSALTSEEPSLTSSPSSIFSGDKVPGTSGSKSGPGSDSVRIGRPAEDEDAAVEFSDHPTADPESSSAALAGPLTPMKKPKHPGEKVDFDAPKKLSAATGDDQDSGKVDWGMASVEDSHEATIGFPQAMLDAPLSGHTEPWKEIRQSGKGIDCGQIRSRLNRPRGNCPRPVHLFQKVRTPRSKSTG